MGKILTKTQHIAIREQKLEEEAALTIQGHSQISNAYRDYHGNAQFRRHSRSRESSRPMYLIFLAYFLNPLAYPGRVQIRGLRPHISPSFSSFQNPQFRGARPPITCYSYGQEQHIARDCWQQQQQQHSLNFIGFDNHMSYYPDPNQLNLDVVFSNYYNQNWYIYSGASSHLTGDNLTLDLGTLNNYEQTVSTADGVSYPV